MGKVLAGITTSVDGYVAADHWGDTNPWGKPFFIVTHRRVLRS